jgi:hypothetical protein
MAGQGKSDLPGVLAYQDEYSQLMVAFVRPVAIGALSPSGRGTLAQDGLVRSTVASRPTARSRLQPSLR